MGTHYDLTSLILIDGKPCHCAYEIKERNKDDWAVINQPYSELKDQKVKAILKETNSYSGVFYISIVNGNTAYMWNLRQIDWDKQDSFIWHIKKTQFSRSSEMEDALTYKLYWKDAVLKADISKYIEEFNNSQN
jgi:hypothetical protein